MRRICRVFVLGLCFLPVILTACRRSETERPGIATALARLERMAEHCAVKNALARWGKINGDSSESATFGEDSICSRIGDPVYLSIALNLKNSTRDTKMRRRADLLYGVFLRAYLDRDGRVAQLADALWDLRQGGQLSFGERLSSDSLHNVLIAEADREKRRLTHLAGTGIGVQMADGLIALARVRNQAAIGAGYKSYLQAVFDIEEIDLSRYRNLLKELDEATREPYREVLNSLAHGLGIDQMAPWDVDFAFGRVDNEVAQYFSGTGQIPLVRATLADIGFTLDALPIYIEYGDSIRSFDRGYCEVVHVPEDCRVAVNLRGGHREIRDIFALLGRGLYATHTELHEYLLASQLSPALDEGVALFMTYAIESDAWLRKYGALPEPLLLDMAMKRRFWTLYSARKGLLEAQFELALYEDGTADARQLYRSLYEQYLFMTIPGDYYPWAADPDYLDRPVSKQSVVLGMCIAAQLYDRIISRYGSVTDNIHTRNFLYQNLFRFGAREPWEKILQRATGEKLRAEYLLKLIVN